MASFQHILRFVFFVLTSIALASLLMVVLPTVSWIFSGHFDLEYLPLWVAGILLAITISLGFMLGYWLVFRHLKAFLITCTVTLACLTIASVGLAVQGIRAYEGAWARWKAQGHPTDIETLQPIIPAGEVNAADRYKTVIPQLEQLDDQLNDQQHDSLYNPDDASQDSLQTLLTPHHKLLKQLHEISAIKHCRWPTMRSFMNDWGRHLLPLRTAARLLRAEAVYRRRQGKMDAAADSLEALAKLSIHVGSSPNLIAILNEYSMAHMVLDELEIGWSSHNALPPAHILTTLEQGNHLANLAHDYEAEALRWPATLSDVRNTTQGSSTIPLQTFDGASPWLIIPGQLHRDMALGINKMNHVIEVVRKPRYEENLSELSVPDMPAWAPLSSVLFPAVTPLVRPQAQYRAHLAMA